MAVGLCLGVALCKPHKCHQCGTQVGHSGLHGRSCWSQGRYQRHAAVNDLLKRWLASAKIRSLLEPTGITRSDGRRPNGISVRPWRNGQTLVWDATCPDAFALTHVASLQGKQGWGAAKLRKQKPRSTLILVPATILFQSPSKHQWYLGPRS